MSWRKLTRKDLVNLMRRTAFMTGGLTEDKIRHSTAVADIALRIADAMIEGGKDVDRKAVEAGALFHDMGLVKVGICEPVRASPEHCGWGGWLCRKWGFPETVAQIPECHECWTPELAKRLNFPKPIQKSYFPTLLESKIGCWSDWCGGFAYGLNVGWKSGRLRFDPWKDPETFYSCEDSWWAKPVPDDHPMIKANIGITKEMLEDRRKKALKVQMELRKLCFPYLKKSYFTKSIRERMPHPAWRMGSWFPIPESARQPTEMDLLNVGLLWTGQKWI